jgi:hypothetical protein
LQYGREDEFGDRSQSGLTGYWQGVAVGRIEGIFPNHANHGQNEKTKPNWALVELGGCFAVDGQPSRRQVRSSLLSGWRRLIISSSSFISSGHLTEIEFDPPKWKVTC